MLWIIVIFLAFVFLLSVAIASGSSKKDQKKEELNTLTQSRISAYADYIKRTGAIPETEGMTENEIHDFIQRNIHEYAAETRGAVAILGWIFFLGIASGCIAAIVGSEQDLREIVR